MTTENYAKILHVEDDLSLAEWVSEYLETNGFSVEHVSRGDQVVQKISSQHYDLILLDVMLPDLDGIEVCRHIRQISQIPIIMMTAKADEFDEVIGLEVGANDYVMKPVRPRALLARIKSVLRNNEASSSKKSQQLVFGKLQINQEFKRVLLDDKEIDLTSSLFSLLWLLASHAGEVLSREYVFQTLKGREYDGLDRRFDVLVSTLRKKLDDNPQQPKRIKTIWGKGYLFIADAWFD
ncbi:response regulator transcription factor [Paraglaciecola aquimarina]|uniref:Response regulator transcription factor n=1 Tax=Paraglaciecola aquimarina TaxID=1235557 RepID=A0ABU3SUH1_9ALTE|nr:response regulator transcription factor [Paraglaciecola aquimarina]MDU0353632.1 response regulator transcription factor [Paraglaciecola aquimarina]